MARHAPRVRTATPPAVLASEAALVEQLLTHLPGDLASGANASVTREVAVGRSVADVVCRVARARRFAACVPGRPLSVLESVILATLRVNGPTGLDALGERCGFTTEALRGGAIDRLAEWCLVDFASAGDVSACRRWTDAFSVIAIEAKLTRWRDALRQAAEYRRYADRSYVALPRSCAAVALEGKAAFAEAGVGLLLVDAKGVTVAFNAPSATEHDWRREFVLSRLAPAQ